MHDRASHASGWLAKAASDLAAARSLVAAGAAYDAACFHAQQAAEKALKAILAFADAPIPRTHNLEDLHATCFGLSPLYPTEALASLDLSELTPFAVELRYDIEFWPERDVAEQAVALAERVVEVAKTIIATRG